MDAARERRILDAFDAAVGWPEDARDARLAELLDDDRGLIDAVQALLTAERDADLMPTRPPEPSALSREAPPPDRVGAYRLSALIGRGGMGAVYRGERIDGGFDQTVAVKLIRGGLFTAAAAQQFARERQILARLHHPHITQLYDGGLTADGQSYIVMELVHGDSILDHVQSHRLGLNDRLSLFADVCAAIDYAHSQGVVHSDIKPSNIVIDPRHGVKLLDFGIAGLIGDDARPSAQRAATPMFASPQQSAHAPASAADDIHALGVLLQVLAGNRPGFDSELAAVAAKARAPEPSDRYPTAKDLADDIDRWRRRYPVQALPARRVRELTFFWRRNRLGVSLTAAAAGGLILAVAVMTALFLQAEAARRQSDQRFEEVRALSRYMLSDLTGALEQFPGTARLRSDLAHRARSYLEGLSRIPRAPDDVRLEVAQGYAKTGDILVRLGRQNAGDPSAGKVDLVKAEASLRQLLAQDPHRGDVALALAGVLVSRAGVAVTADNQPALAAPLFAEACALAQGVIGRDPRSAKAHAVHLSCLLGQANMLDFQGRFAQSFAVTGAYLTETRAGPPASDPTAAALGQGKILNLRGDADYYLDRKPDALADYQAAVAALQRPGVRAADVRVLDELANTTYNIAGSLDEIGARRAELDWIDRGVAAADRVRTFEDSPHAWRTANMVHMQRALTLAGLGRGDEAVAEAAANIALRRDIALHSPHDNLAVRAVPVGMRTLGDIYWTLGRRREACGAYAQTRALWDQLARRNGLLGSDSSTELPIVDNLLTRCRDQAVEPSSPR